MVIPNIVIQLIGFAGTAAYLVSFQFKKNRHLFMMQTAGYIFYTLHYYLLGALTGAGSYMVNLLRSILLSSGKKWATSWWACAGLCALQIAVMWLTWAGWISLLPCAANIASTIGGYTYNARKIRAANLFVNSPLCIVYAVIVGSWAGIIDEAISMLSIIASIIRFGWNNLDRIEE